MSTNNKSSLQRYRNSQRGFTLVDLLVIVSVIGLLLSLMLTSVNVLRARGYDTTRKAEMRQLQTALELYHNDHGEYPTTHNVWFGDSPMGGNKTIWVPNLAPKYVSELPTDPNYTPSACGGWGGTYLYRSNGANYKLIDHCPQASTVTSVSSSNPFYDPSRETWAWQISTPDAVYW